MARAVAGSGVDSGFGLLFFLFLAVVFVFVSSICAVVRECVCVRWYGCTANGGDWRCGDDGFGVVTRKKSSEWAFYRGTLHMHSVLSKENRFSPSPASLSTL